MKQSFSPASWNNKPSFTRRGCCLEQIHSQVRIGLGIGLELHHAVPPCCESLSKTLIYEHLNSCITQDMRSLYRVYKWVCTRSYLLNIKVKRVKLFGREEAFLADTQGERRGGDLRSSGRWRVAVLMQTDQR